MDSLISRINKLKRTNISELIKKRIIEFEKVGRSSSKRWFSELCFCILTANSKAKTAINIQNELDIIGFCTHSPNSIRSCIIKNKHRFHNNKTKYIIEARKHIDIKDELSIIPDEKDKREWLVKNIKGLGYKEASHFLRNIGYKDLAILDRHILNLLVENRYIKEKPKSLAKTNYLFIENILANICKSLNLTQSELDMYMWYMKTGEVLK